MELKFKVVKSIKIFSIGERDIFSYELKGENNPLSFTITGNNEKVFKEALGEDYNLGDVIEFDNEKWRNLGIFLKRRQTNFKENFLQGLKGLNLFKRKKIK